ncbi:divergent PAP2 family protein [Candidatus Woesearchaeota archaeon]|nr:divergent PAP2 family protein [Candidatus Woesearchaeota archaeon]
MYWLIQLFQSYYFVSFFIAWILSCIIKSFTRSHQKGGKYNFRYGFQNGGMPSSHSASVTSIVVAIGYVDMTASGVLSRSFYVALVLALIVVSDAFGVRKNIGQQGDMLNQLLKKYRKDPIKVVYGHTFLQVIAGMILGVLVSSLMYYVFF